MPAYEVFSIHEMNAYIMHAIQCVQLQHANMQISIKKYVAYRRTNSSCTPITQTDRYRTCGETKLDIYRDVYYYTTSLNGGRIQFIMRAKTANNFPRTLR
eukprot:TRINITY_DN3266_c0_g1_i1.p1 TRINITY_DN3266_c0_g1~~TRINITY_DN3266_c0_g1_i1.p1  ORF type:complete len:100 (+),score=23.66 TRINITY_DN3266_c0_g1_i1:231-530(+)